MSKELTNEYVAGLISAQFGESIHSTEHPYGMLTMEVAVDSIHNLIEWLKNHDELAVQYLTNIGAVNYPDDKGREMAVVYHLHSLVHNFRIRLKVFLPIDNLQIPSIVDLFVAANWMERETFDFYGVEFNGHPNLVRILNEDSMDYFPMRKEYHLEDATREDKDDRFFGR